MKYPLVVAEWSIPLPGTKVKLIMPPQAYVQAMLTNGCIVVTCFVENKSAAYSLEFYDSLSGKFSYVSRVAGIARVDNTDVLLRPDHVAATLDGISLFLIEEIEMENKGYGKVSGNEIVIHPSDVDKDLVVRLATTIYQVSEQKVFPFLRNVSLQKARLGYASVGIDAAALDETENALSTARKALENNDYLTFAGFMWLAYIPSVGWAKEHMMESLYNLVSKNELVTLNDYVRGACNFTLGVIETVLSLDLATSRAQKEEETAARAAALRRLRSEIDKLLQELGEEDYVNPDVVKINKALAQKELPDEVRAYIQREVRKLESPFASHWAEAEVALKHINFLLELPWNERAEHVEKFEEVVEYLNSKLYGLRKAKEAVLDYLAALHRKPGSVKGTVLCFVGPPGTGKTDMARRIAESLKRPFIKISLGGVNDEAEIRGHRRTYVGALPGSIMKALAQAKVKNPVILLDEIDKMSVGVRGDPAAALMEALDPEFNNAFLDHFVDFPFDLSEVLFICAANVIETIPPALRDRLNIIEFRPYTPKEKFTIAKDYIIPKVKGELGIGEGEVDFTDDSIWAVINYYTFESGVRELYRIIRKVVTRNLRLHYKIITPSAIDEILWDEPKQVWRYRRHSRYGVGAAPIIGVASGTGEGVIDVLMFQPVVQLDGSGNEDKVQITYNTDDLGKQTVLLALECARRLSGAPLPYYRWIVHQTNPSVYSHGTSFGVSAALAVLSVFKKQPLRDDWVYTGEIDIHGYVHAVGGIATKIATAEAYGYKRIYIPKENEHDLAALDFTPEIEVVPVSHVKEIIASGVFRDERDAFTRV